MLDKFEFKKNEIPKVESLYRNSSVHLPDIINIASGIIIHGRRIKSLIFSTDIAVIRNCNADAVLAVYPFSPQQVIMQAIIKNSNIPVFCGIGGGITSGMRSNMMAKDAEAHGAIGVVVNTPFDKKDISIIKKLIDIPIVATVVSSGNRVDEFLEAGVSILNVSGGINTPEIVADIRKKYPKVPIIATGGKTDESIKKTIDSGANTISYTPPSAGELFRKIMDGYRENDNY